MEDLNNAIKSGDTDKVLEILKSDKTLSFKKGAKNKTPFLINFEVRDNLEIDDILLCADEKVFKFEVYAPYVLNEKNIS